jgi:hypothetical protein
MWTTTAKCGTALQFNGIDNVVEVSTDDIFYTPPFTLSVWFRVSQLPSDKGEHEVIVVKTTLSGASASWSIMLPDSSWSSWMNRIIFRAYDSAGSDHSICSDSVINIDMWYHVICTLDSAYDMKLYVNNVLQTRTANSGSMYTYDPGCLHAGAASAEGWRLIGILDEMRFFNREISASDRSTLYNLKGRVGNGLSAEWKFDENGGRYAYDTSGEEQGQDDRLPVLSREKTMTFSAAIDSQGHCEHKFSDGARSKSACQTGEYTEDYSIVTRCLHSRKIHQL